MYCIEDLYKLFSNSLGVSTDTRQNQQGKLFIGLRGDRFDGNGIALEAIRGGATAAIVDREDLQNSDGCYYVKNSLTALQRIAHHHRMRFKIPVLGITGTNGKTTTKELIASVLSQKYQICSTQGNLNNHIGVPLTLLRIDDRTEVAIIEMGANHPGEIGWLCQIAAPTMGIVTNVGQAHLEGFGDLASIWNTKMDLYRYLEAREGMIFINETESSLDSLIDISFKHPVRFDETHISGQVVSVSFIDESNSIKMILRGRNGQDFSTEAKIYGKHNHHNLLAAIVIGSQLHVAPELICQGITKYEAKLNRSQIVVKASNTFYLDAYNANPTSMRKALEFFDSIKASRKVAILGDMLELGKDSQHLHREILALVNTLDVGEVILVGDEFAKCQDQRPLPSSWKWFKTAGDLAIYLNTNPYQQTHFLVKGSRSIKLESILQ
ncbi:MAG: UDP-N-acetylmuramoyl-tripeptide--D-alanyl-D-alanine ligase [Saprospiraceae bacterium]|nr:UDP-N-acetylmuramoyl-tripeptide--D-alanyl-D-alanine ligase [Saprospiraceae bacterium]